MFLTLLPLFNLIRFSSLDNTPLMYSSQSFNTMSFPKNVCKKLHFKQEEYYKFATFWREFNNSYRKEQESDRRV